MGAKKMNEVEESLCRMMNSLFRLFIGIITAGITIFMMFGLLAAFILLYKMFPDTAFLLFNPMIIVFSILSKIIWAVAVAILILYVILIYVSFTNFINKQKIKREANRNKLIDEIVAKLKKGTKGK